MLQRWTCISVPLCTTVTEGWYCYRSYITALVADFNEPHAGGPVRVPGPAPEARDDTAPPHGLPQRCKNLLTDRTIASALCCVMCEL
jgi:hypothetical protein